MKFESITGRIYEIKRKSGSKRNAIFSYKIRNRYEDRGLINWILGKFEFFESEFMIKDLCILPSNSMNYAVIIMKEPNIVLAINEKAFNYIIEES